MLTQKQALKKVFSKKSFADRFMVAKVKGDWWLTNAHWAVAMPEWPADKMGLIPTADEPDGYTIQGEGALRRDFAPNLASVFPSEQPGIEYQGTGLTLDPGKAGNVATTILLGDDGSAAFFDKSYFDMVTGLFPTACMAAEGNDSVLVGYVQGEPVFLLMPVKPLADTLSELCDNLSCAIMEGVKA